MFCVSVGNSVHADKKFLDKYMPQFMRHLHYRIIDVSTVKELCRSVFPARTNPVRDDPGKHVNVVLMVLFLDEVNGCRGRRAAASLLFSRLFPSGGGTG